MSKNIKSNSIRIIAGNWRGRRLPVLDADGLRPTTDRVRETLFNWLMHDIAGASCLDLFAGSGALGLESLSRGADYVQFFESNRTAADNIQACLEQLGCATDMAKVVNQNALAALTVRPQRQFNVVFLDPPFEAEYLQDAVRLLDANDWLEDDALIYIERAAKGSDIEIPQSWQLFKQGKVGQSAFELYNYRFET